MVFDLQQYFNVLPFDSYRSVSLSHSNELTVNCEIIGETKTKKCILSFDNLNMS